MKFAEHVQHHQNMIDDLVFQVAVIDGQGMMQFSNLSKPQTVVDLSEREHFRVHADALHQDRLFISKPERVRIRLEPMRGERVDPLILCAPDGSLWLTRDEARRHFSRAGLLSHYFREEKITVDPPKGAFTTVAICGSENTTPIGSRRRPGCTCGKRAAFSPANRPSSS